MAPVVQGWHRTVPWGETFLSVLVLGELRHGIELLRGKDLQTAIHLGRWLDGLSQHYELRILSVTMEIADLWGRLSPTQRVPATDGLMAATALVHDLTLVTRNTRDFERSGVRLLNPFVSS